MWLLPSLSRPARLEHMASTYDWTGVKGVRVLLHEDDSRLEDYRGRNWPKEWEFFVLSGRAVGEIADEAFRLWPNEDFYGSLSDDIELQTPGMLDILGQKASRRWISWPNEGHHGERLCAFACIGGDLVRAAGRIALGGLKHNGIDCAWHEVGKAFGALRYCPELKLRHLHPAFSLANTDEVYERGRRDSANATELYTAWHLHFQEKGYAEMCRKLDEMDEDIL